MPLVQTKNVSSSFSVHFTRSILSLGYGTGTETAAAVSQLVQKTTEQLKIVAFMHPTIEAPKPYSSYNSYSSHRSYSHYGSYGPYNSYQTHTTPPRPPSKPKHGKEVQGCHYNEHGSDLAKLYGECVAHDLKSCASHLLQQLENQMTELKAEEAQGLFLPFLRHLTAVLDYRKVLLDELEIQTVYRMLTSYLFTSMGDDPVSPTYWTRQATSCKCDKCTPVNRFLRAPDQPVGRFPMAERYRRHVEEHLMHLVGRFLLRCHTECRGSPHTLVVTKTNDSWEHKRETWRETRATLLHEIQELGDKVKQECLSIPEGTPLTIDLLTAVPPETSDAPTDGLQTNSGVTAPERTNNVLREKERNIAQRRPDLETGTKHPTKQSGGSSDGSKQTAEVATNPLKRKAVEVIDMTND